MVGVCPKLNLHWKKAFFTQKKVKVGNKDSAQKVLKKFFYFTDTNVYNNSVLLFHFFRI